MKMLYSMLALTGLLGSATTAVGQTFPTRAITILVPFAAGGPTDTVARIVADPMRKFLGQALVIENVTGAGGSIAIGRAARAAPDGYTLIVGNWSSHVGSPAMYPIPYDVLSDFEPISLLPLSRLWLIGKLALPAKNASELVAWLRANPNKASMGIVGIGSAAHVCGIYLQIKAGAQIQFVPYRGAAPAYQDLIAGNLDLVCGDAPTSLTYVRSGQIRAYAVLGGTRWSPAPDVPTLDEIGVPGLHISFWNGLWAPKGTSKDVIAKLNSAVVDALADASLRKRVAELGQEIPPREQQTPEALGAFHRAEVETWQPIVKAAGIKPD